MKKIIGGSAYNTETATILANVNLTGHNRNARGAINLSDEASKVKSAGSSSLYQTRGGAFFLVREVNEGLYAEPDIIGGSRPYVNDAGLYPLTRKQALAWAESRLDAHKIEAIFGIIAEAGDKASAILLRLPETLKTRLEDAAEGAEQSVNAWAVRCLECCINRDEVGQYIGEILQTTRACTSMEAGAYSKATLREMLSHIDGLVETAAALLSFKGKDLENLMTAAINNQNTFHRVWREYEEDDEDGAAA